MDLPAQVIRALSRGPLQVPTRYVATFGASTIATPLIEPFVERTVHEPTGMSFGLSACSYDVRLDQDITIYPHYLNVPREGRYSFLLASTMERVALPSFLSCNVRDKSTLIRLGLSVHNTHFDPGWRGYATLELANHGSDIIRLPAGSPIAQLVFTALLEPTDQPYRGKYQDQERGPIGARRETVGGSIEWVLKAEPARDLGHLPYRCEIDMNAFAFCQCEHPIIRCDIRGCRCTSCGLPERLGAGRS